ncbi:MAG: hypothetical protein ACRDP8_16985 [Actinopolymorphaceae bacterium]
MSWRTYRWYELAADERDALAGGYGCGLCLDCEHLEGVGPCPRCRPDDHAEHLLATADAQLAATWTEEHDNWEAA